MREAFSGTPCLSLLPSCRFVWKRLGTAISRASRVFDNSGKVCQSNNCNVIKDKISDFRPKVPAIVALRNPGMKPRHWEELSEKVGTTVGVVWEARALIESLLDSSVVVFSGEQKNKNGLALP